MLRAVILSAVMCVGSAFAQDGPPELEPAFSDDFSEDTRADYEIEGVVSWVPGRLTLDDGVAIERAVSGGSWVNVELGLEFPELTDERPQSELRVWFRLDGATDCCVRFRRRLEGERTVAAVALIDTQEKDGTIVEQLVREVTLAEADLRTLNVAYRQGLVRVALSGVDAFAGYVSNGLATVDTVVLKAHVGQLAVHSLTANASRREEREYSETERQRIADATAAERQMSDLYKQGKVGEAAKIAEKIRGTRKALLGEFHPDHTRTVRSLGALYERLGQRSRAAAAYQEAAAICNAVVGPQHPDYAARLSDLAVTYRNMGAYPRAESLYTEALKIRKAVLGEQHPDYASSLNSLGLVLFRLGDYDRSEKLYERALAIRKTALGEQHPDYSTSLANLASLYQDLGDYTRAESLHKQALDIRKSRLGDQHPDFANSLNNLAVLYRDMGDYGRAESLQKQATEICKTALGTRHPSYAISLNNLAFLYYFKHDYVRAEPLYLESLEIRKSILGERHPAYATVLNNLGLLYTGMGDYERAELLYKQALELRESILGERHPSFAASLRNLAQLYARKGEHQRAAVLLRRSCDLRKAALGERHPSYASSLHDLAVLYGQMGDFTRAVPLCKQALKLKRSLLGEGHRDYAASLDALAFLYDMQGDYEKAEPLHQEALDVVRATLGERHPSLALSLNNLAFLYEATGDRARAEPLYVEAMQIQRGLLNSHASVQSARQQSHNQLQVRFYLDSRLSTAAASGIQDPSAVAADLWQWKGAVTARQSAYRRVADNPELAPLFADLQSVTQQVASATGNVPIPPAESRPASEHRTHVRRRQIWEQRLARLTSEREDLERQIASVSADFRRITEPLTTATVQSFLPPGTALVDFLEYRHGTPSASGRGRFEYERRYLALIVPQDGQVSVVGLGSVEAIADAITEFRRPLTEATASQDRATQASRRLREMLWLPLEKHLRGIDTVIISPDTAIGTLPFPALPGKTRESYLIEEYKFASLPLAGMLRSLLGEQADRPQPEKGLLVVGDVNYDANSSSPRSDTSQGSRPAWMRHSAPRGASGRWESLPGFQQELAIVRDQFEKQFGGGITTLRNEKATESDFIQLAARHYNLHLVTHGFFADPDFEAMGTSTEDASRAGPEALHRQLAGNRMINQYMPGVLSGLVLAGANNPPPSDDPSADGILTASEIETLDLNAVDLVVLSACETGLGKTAGGEGLTGLQRAFHIAGVRSCITTLWKVDDQATQELMSRFYRKYWEQGQSKIDALRNAQLEILRNPRLVRGDVRKRNSTRAGDVPTERTSPYFWAAFTLSGDWR